MRKVIASIRLFLVGVFLFVATIVALIASFIPFKVGGASLASWIVVALARSILWAFNVRLDISDKARLQAHQGLFYPTHDSFLDIVIPIAISPVRFLAAIEVKEKWLIGRLATAIGCVYVDRRNKASRKAARDSLTNLTAYPPIVLYPEGMLDGKPGIAPFRYGAFDLAIQNKLSYIPLVLLYDDFWAVKWKYESMLAPAWRTAMRWRTDARVVALETITPKPENDPAVLAHSAERAVIHTIATQGGGDYSVVNIDDEPEMPAVSWETHVDA